MYKKIIFLLCTIAFASCNEDAKIEKEIAAVPVDFEVVRFDREFAEAMPQKLMDLKQEYPFLFPQQFPDSVWIEKLNDTIQQEINTEVGKAFPSFENKETQLHSLFQHIKYYFPQFKAPKVFTVTSEVDYKNKVILQDDYLFISLDTYLGEGHHFYVGIQEFLKKNFRKDQIIPDVANAYAEKYVDRPESRTFLAHMIYYGKLLYLKDRFIPETADAEKMGYTKGEFNWAQNNEAQMWRYFVENELFFDTNTELYSRFLYPAPFSKFYLELDAESPARLGQYIGWQIVRSYMEKTDASLKEMIKTDAETIFNKANFKPRK
ncbi:gliding motility lipoprotein GldB [Salegentibacter salegens]|uniref:Protein involved in gliding motility GldB n=1 Tax=Salegentibacter salegens TaxID=143223 RepID=A0A1M7I1S2_9FLAO|nr:gliding motility lipoprotein GldB [Salegentibacter salegens]PRX45289.1 gliding motility-associated lipoprotein GldB [Salegentibacter salegens]SHM34347.1 protein involved in gliding motility GldB [Salegentibacter salegens]